MSTVCRCMFQMPLHFNRTGVPVVAMCPGATVQPFGEKDTRFSIKS